MPILAEAGVTVNCGCGFSVRGTDAASSVNVIEKGLAHSCATGHFLDIHGKIMPVKEMPAWTK